MLNIFRGKTTPPNYRLAVPPSGELQTITAHEEVGSEETHDTKSLRILIKVLDLGHTPLCGWCHFTKY